MAQEKTPTGETVTTVELGEHFTAFDSLEAAQAWMASQTMAANENLAPWQRDLLTKIDETVYWVRVVRDYGNLPIFGVTPSLKDGMAGELRCYDKADGGGKAERVEDLDADDRAEYEYSAKSFAENRARGYLFSRCYSFIEPDGELGDTHAINVLPITEALFEQGKANGWQIDEALRLAVADHLRTLSARP